MESFERFWEAYPKQRRVAKIVAKKSWDKLDPPLEIVDAIVKAVEHQKLSRQWKSNFIPLPATWLNQRRWEDEIVDETPETPVHNVRYSDRYIKKSGVSPQAHKCHPIVSQVFNKYHEQKERHITFSKLTLARAILAIASWYEATHVACAGEFHPVCPRCGLSQAPYENPEIKALMAQYPEQTKGWNVLHKGFLTCAQCSKELESYPNIHGRSDK